MGTLGLSASRLTQGRLEATWTRCCQLNMTSCVVWLLVRSEADLQVKSYAKGGSSSAKYIQV